VAKTVAAQAAEAPVVGRLITPSHVTAEPKPSVPVIPQVQPERAADPSPMPMPVAMPMAVAAVEEMSSSPAFDPSKAAFDPSNAVIEQFGATSDDVLDKFVRDFEMQDARPRRRKTTRLPETHSYGAEAPQVP
jgi:hypothetical protein